MSTANKQILQTAKIIILALILAFGISYLHAAWTGPTDSPPLGNTPAPLNVGNISQTKSAGLELLGGLIANNAFFYGDVHGGPVGTYSPSPFALHLRQGGNNKVEGLALQAKGTSATWAWAE